ncbi:hypothetical protein SAMN05518865_104268 [Duganella sp. CF458]|uniref:hypothetical protein n=1 Tax=Duganella sp. CF458 TaxID=1884368 RepID=UPI0008EA5666|nr:hypothetical protein [Duganella sp. CF458]SFF77329.1 hypothetical protein SAMN05518865_104268 [Duganella sp. CF458]
MKLIIAMLGLVFSQAAPAGASSLPASDEAAAFKAAGFKQHGKTWKSCSDSGASYVPGAIEQVKDLNGDGQPEAIITESGTACYGDTGVGYALVSKQSDGKWKLITQGAGILTVLHTKGKDGWPDLEIGGPGFCFPIERWNGSAYKQHQLQYDGKPCKR